ncbi:DUF4926 domain-containing protein [Spirosoma validum]|uniref:DUF4926 domain-containing protein n=1 Tax=Spirosoma validum TaxID=2771355 RepID=A0A927GF00_9BACT|nr:DUF4926 domain-containing protein [Spirosoma validum]MBD2755213.1 DUF4926 domain-containing protein [Spirosoma validum]
MDELHLHDLVALTSPLPGHKLRRGEIGVIVDVGPNGDCLLEFSGKDGVPYATPTVPANRLMKVYLHVDMAD